MREATQNSKLKTQDLANVALPVCLAAMDACWLYTVGWLFVGTALEGVTSLPLPSPVILAGVTLAAWALAAFLLDKTKLPTWLVQVVAMLAGVELSIVIMAVLNPPAGGVPSLRWFEAAATGLALSFILWLRGLYTSTSS
jgi:hypothetical protein